MTQVQSNLDDFPCTQCGKQDCPPGFARCRECLGNAVCDVCGAHKDGEHHTMCPNRPTDHHECRSITIEDSKIVKGGKIMTDNEPKSEALSPGIDQIPFEGIEAIGTIFDKGEAKYGRDNWKKGIGKKSYQAERCRHALRHLWLYANGDRSENHLAKVAWFCVTQIWCEKQEKCREVSDMQS